MSAKKFNELWQDTINAVSFETRRAKNPDKVDKENMENYYKVNLISNLWFSKTLVNDYNEWISDNVPIESHSNIKKIMLDINIPSNKQRASLVLGILTFAFVVLSFILTNTILISIMRIIALLSLGVCIYCYMKCKKTTNRTVIINELQRIGKKVESTLETIHNQ